MLKYELYKYVRKQIMKQLTDKNKRTRIIDAEFIEVPRHSPYHRDNYDRCTNKPRGYRSPPRVYTKEQRRHLESYDHGDGSLTGQIVAICTFGAIIFGLSHCIASARYPAQPNLPSIEQVRVEQDYAKYSCEQLKNTPKNQQMPWHIASCAKLYK